MKWAVQKLRLAAEAVRENPGEPDGYRALTAALTDVLESWGEGPGEEEAGVREVLGEVAQALARSAKAVAIFAPEWAERFGFLSGCLAQAVMERVQ